MRKIAFSIWPGYDELPAALQALRERSIKILEADGWTVVLHKDVDPVDSFHKKMADQWKPNATGRFYTKLSDYLRVWYLEKYLDEGYDQVYYFDCDLLILRAPKGVGTAVEMHLQSDDGEGGNIVKWWMRNSVNCAYLVGPNQREHVRKHMKEIQTLVDGVPLPKYCYPMNLMYMFDAESMYIDNHFLLGNYFDDPDWYTKDNALDLMQILGWMTGKKPTGVDAINAMGSRGFADVDTYVEANLKIVEDLDEAVRNLTHTREDLVRIANRVKNARLRPNYGSHGVRQAMKDFIKEFAS